MASPTGTPTGTIRLNIVDGRRQPIPETLSLLVRVLDGRKQQVATRWVKGPTIPIMGLPFHDNPDDWYTLIVHADGYQDAGVCPVRLQAGRLIDAYANPRSIPPAGMHGYGKSRNRIGIEKEAVYTVYTKITLDNSKSREPEWEAGLF